MEAINNFTEEKLFAKASEFRLCISLHRIGVLSLALKLVEERTDAFPALTGRTNLIEEYLDLHDLTKLNPLYFWDLLKFFGSNLRMTAGTQRARLLRTIGEVNRRDEENAQMFFSSHRWINEDGTLQEIARELKVMERICDVVDRGTSPWALKEFGRPLSKGSQILSDPREVEIALWLEGGISRLHFLKTPEIVYV